METYKQHTFQIAKCLTSLANAETYAATLAREPAVKFGSRQVLNRISNRCKMAVKEMTDMLTPDSLALVRTEILPEEICLQLEVITDMVLALPPGIRDEIETYVKSRYDIYKLHNIES